MTPVDYHAVQSIPHSFSFGCRELWPNVFMAPMAGVSDLPFRRLISELANGRISLFVSEFVSARVIVNSRHHELRGMRFDREGPPFCLQLFVGEPELASQAVKIVEQKGVDFIEINAGCPVPKMVRKGGGSQLLRDLPRLRKVLAAARSATTLPLSVKVRLGWNDREQTLLETARMAQEEGLDLFVVHGRTREQQYSGRANWEAIAMAAAELSIPVVGNGDLRSAGEIVSAIQRSGVAAVAVGRGAVHNPWIFGQVADLWSGGQLTMPTALEQQQLFWRYKELMEEDGLSPVAQLGRLKLLAARFCRAVEGAQEARLQLIRSASQEEFALHLERFYHNNPTARFLPEQVETLNG